MPVFGYNIAARIKTSTPCTQPFATTFYDCIESTLIGCDTYQQYSIFSPHRSRIMSEDNLSLIDDNIVNHSYKQIKSVNDV